MKTINVTRVYNYLKNKKHIIAAIFIAITALFLYSNINTYIETQKAKEILLNQKLESAKAELEENKEEIFYMNESRENKEKKKTISSEIEYLRLELDKLNTYDECVVAQLDRLASNQEVDLEYCEKFNEEVTEEAPVEAKAAPATDTNVATKKEVEHKTDDQVIAEAIDFIKHHEGVRYTAYWDVKQYSICYGTRSTKGATATQEECDQLLKERVQSELLRVNRMADGIGGNKKAALVSFFYNVGYKSNVLQYAARGDDKSVVYLMSLYNSAGGKVLP